MQNVFILIGFLTCLAISLLIIPSISRIARKKEFFGRQRDGSEKKIPTLGGLALFAGLIISLNLYADVSAFPLLPYITAGSVILFFIGLKDDILIIAPWWKLLGQLLAALIITVFGGLRIVDPGRFVGLEGSGAGAEVLLSVLLILVLINSLNLIDGIDGLASGIGILACAVFGLIFYKAGLQAWFLVAASLCGGLAGFTWYNVFGRKMKIYMGDTGSLLLGFILAVMVIRFFNIPQPRLLEIRIQAPIAFAFAVLIVPLFDVLRIVVLRLLRGRSPLRPGRLHIHYRLVDAGLTHLRASGLLLGLNLIMIILAIGFGKLGEIPAVLILAFPAAVLSIVADERLKRKKKLTGKSRNEVPGSGTL